MILVVTEKNDAAQKVSELMADTKPKADKVYNTTVYRFSRDGEDWVAIGLRGHILEMNFVDKLEYKKRAGWIGIDAEGNEMPASDIPDRLEKPPFKKRRPFTENGMSLKEWSIPVLPYLVYAPVTKYPKEKDVIRSLKNLAKKADKIIIATDFDREGELIGSDAVLMVREVSEAPVLRARYSAFTKAEITHAFTNLVELDKNLAEAGDSRRVIDLVWGAVLTRYLTKANSNGFGNTKSAGRVQTPTLALIVAKERERMAFKPEDYWVIKGKCTNDAGEDFSVTHRKGRFSNEADANSAFDKIKGADHATVVAIDKKTRTVKPPTPFNTTSLQTSAAAIGMTPARVMRVAESLYMSGYISYPRVDNTVYPDSLDLRETVKMLSGNPDFAPYTKKLLAKGKLTPTRGKMQTTDHPPIYPTGCPRKDQLDAGQWKLYNLVARRFLATLSGAAQIEATKVTVDVNGQEMEARGDALVVPGFREIYQYGSKKEELLPVLSNGEVLGFSDPQIEKKQTEPPARYSQAKLIQEMERLGLGTKSTRHSTIERLLEVKYIQDDPIMPTQLGIAVIDALGQFAPKIVSPDMTSELEHEMSQITVGQNTIEHVVGDSRAMLDGVIETLIPKKDEVKDALSEAVQADAKVGVCPKCGKDLLLKNSPKTKSHFIGCSGWPDCDVTYPVPKGKLQPVEEPCPVCGGPQIRVIVFRQKTKVMCVDPNCKSNFEPKVDVGLCKACEERGKVAHLIAQKNPKTLKRFIRCENYEECETSYPLPPNGEIKATGERCETCGAPMVVIMSKRGPWRICPNMKCPTNDKEKKAAAKKEASASGKAADGKAATKKSRSAAKAAISKKAATSGSSSRKASTASSKGAAKASTARSKTTKAADAKASSAKTASAVKTAKTKTAKKAATTATN